MCVKWYALWVRLIKTFVTVELNTVNLFPHMQILWMDVFVIMSVVVIYGSAVYDNRQHWRVVGGRPETKGLIECSKLSENFTANSFEVFDDTRIKRSDRVECSWMNLRDASVLFCFSFNKQSRPPLVPLRPSFQFYRFWITRVRTVR